MAYVKTNWVDDVTPLSATNMNNIEDGLINTNNIEETLSEHMAELASKHIRETGSNVNGSYIKFDDGTMVCYTKLPITSDDIRIIQGSVYVSYDIKSVTFPATFIDTNTIIMGNIHTPSTHASGVAYKCSAWFSTKDAPTVSGYKYVIVSPLSNTNLPVGVMVTAIGRWKA